MSNPILTSLLTIIGGAVVYIIGQTFSKLVLEPAVELRRVIGKVALTLSYHLNLPRGFPNDPGAVHQAGQELPLLAAQLTVQAKSILWYPVAQHVIRAVPPRGDVDQAAAIILVRMAPLWLTPNEEFPALRELSESVAILLRISPLIRLKAAITAPPRRRLFRRKE